MRVEVEHMGDVQFSVSARGHVIYSDQPEESGGYNEGMTPPEMFLGSLGACAAFYAVDYLKRKGLQYEGTRVDAFAEKLKNPARLGEMRLQVYTPAALSEADHQGVMQSVGKCILHSTLTHPPSITTEIHTKE